MWNERKLVCIGCPKGCLIYTSVNDGEILEMSGYGCVQGKRYAEQEMINPVRTVTSTVVVKNGVQKVLPVRTGESIPKAMMFECIRQMKALKIEAPVRAGDIVIKNFNGLGIDIIAAKTVERAEEGEKT